MKPGLHHLYIPGPTNVPMALMRAMQVPMQDHRGPDFPDLTLGLFADLRRVFQTRTARSSCSPGPARAAGRPRSPTP